MVREVTAAHPSLIVQVDDNVRQAVQGADVIVTATTSSSPILEWAWIAPGTHVNAIGSHSPGVRELATEVVARSRIVVDSREAALKEAGDFLIPIREGAMTADAVGTELGQVAAGLRPGRSGRDEVTLYKSCGIALQDVAMARLVYERARRARDRTRRRDLSSPESSPHGPDPDPGWTPRGRRRKIERSGTCAASIRCDGASGHAGKRRQGRSGARGPPRPRGLCVVRRAAARRARTELRRSSFGTARPPRMPSTTPSCSRGGAGGASATPPRPAPGLAGSS